MPTPTFEVRLKPSLEDVSFKGINLFKKTGENFKCLPTIFAFFQHTIYKGRLISWSIYSALLTFFFWLWFTFFKQLCLL